MDLLPADEEATIKCVAHRLPCNLQVDGPAPTARAFCALPHPLTSFRGRKLQSGHLDVCDSSQLIFVEHQKADDPNNTSNTSNPSFSVKYVLETNSFFYQHHDFPDTNSTVPRALQWLSASRALHDPVKVSDPQATENSDDKTLAQ